MRGQGKAGERRHGSKRENIVLLGAARGRNAISSVSVTEKRDTSSKIEAR